MTDKSMDDFDEDSFSVESDYAEPRDDGQAGPPADWPYPSWYNRTTGDWYWKGKLDPCPVVPLGMGAGVYYFVTRAGEIRAFTSAALHSTGGPNDLFVGELAWPNRHFTKWDLAKKAHVGGMSRSRCMGRLIVMCEHIGYYDGATPHRGVGTWGGPDGLPLVNAGDRIFCDGKIYKPGVMLGDARYVIGGKRAAPAHDADRHGGFEWRPCGVEVGYKIAAHLDEWHWYDTEARDLFLGGLCCDMLGDALAWKPHRFVRAQKGSGKTSLLKYMAALLGGAAHPVQRDYTRAGLEQRFTHTSCALLLDETESDVDPYKLRRVLEIVRLLSDEGATGGRGSPGGRARQIDLHGSVTMVATLTEAWTPQDRSRITLMELRPLQGRADHPLITPEAVEEMTEAAAAVSAGVRARVVARFDLFQQNLKIARRKILDMGGMPRDADQLGHLIAGWATMTSDNPMTDEDVRDLSRFQSYVVSLTEEEEGMDAANECFNTLLGLPAHVYKGGEQFTLGQLIARAREPDAVDQRRALLPYGLRLEKLDTETWPQAWLAIANRHPGLDKLLSDYQGYRGPKRAQILNDLRRVIDGQVHEVKRTEGSLRFAGPQSRALLVPPALLPSLADERQDDGGAMAVANIE